jgi:hypothetical protein
MHAMTIAQAMRLRAKVNFNVHTGGVVVVPHRQSMEEFLLEHKAAGTLESPRRISEIERIPGEQQAFELRLNAALAIATSINASKFL